MWRPPHRVPELLVNLITVHHSIRGESCEGGRLQAWHRGRFDYFHVRVGSLLLQPFLRFKVPPPYGALLLLPQSPGDAQHPARKQMQQGGGGEGGGLG